MLTSVLTTAEAAAVSVGVDRVEETGFRVRLFEEEASRRDAELKGHAWERIGYVAIASGAFDGGVLSASGVLGGLRFEAGTSNTGHVPGPTAPTNVTFASSTSSAPLLLASYQTVNGGNTLALRYRDLTSAGVNLYLQEETSSDDELAHVNETLGYLVFDGAGTFDLPSAEVASRAGGEAGRVTLAQVTADSWLTVPLARSYTNPVVVVGPASLQDGEQPSLPPGCGSSTRSPRTA